MAVYPEGAPCWVDAMFSDLEGAKSFYAEVLGWTFGETVEQYGNYTQAYADGKSVGAISSPMPGADGPPAWNLYFATPDIEATARKIREGGGDLLMEPMKVGEFGTMVTAQDPSGVYFSAWQPDQHPGFEKIGETGAFCWAEVNTRDSDKADAFFPAVFPFEVKTMVDEQMDFKLWSVEGEPRLGRLKMTDDFPPDLPPYINVYFAVDDCDAAIETATRLGGRVHFGPVDTPFGRFASVGDPQGAGFSVIDPSKTQGDMPKLT